ncbi:hypothetical protein FACS1894159_08220 [Bacteroidia bacterium]|nr:hypothetical protein FACS1894159_08220 [Bacteroidia bacterium]
MKTNIKYIAVIATTGVVLASCLKTEMVDRKNKDDFFKTETDAQTGLNGIYSYFYPNSYLKWNFHVIEAGSTDCLYTTGGEGQYVTGNTHDSRTAMATNAWANYYNAINVANNVIKYVPQIDFSPATRTVQERILAEAHFLRGLFYYELVRAYGGIDGVPLHLEPVETLEEAYLGDSPVEEVYQAIIDDLKYAALHRDGDPDHTKLPLAKELVAEAGRVTNGAAHAYLADVYNTLGQWELAIKHADTVINSMQYSLMANYADLWDIKKKADAAAEKIFYVTAFADKEAAVADGLGNAMAWLFNVNGFDANGGHISGDATGTGNGVIKVQKWFIRFFCKDIDQLGYSDGARNEDDANLPSKDYRIETTFWRDYSTQNNTTGVFTSRKAYPAGTQNAHIRKYIDPTGANTRTNANDVVKMRLADMYLIKAEAWNELGEYEKACEALDVIRARARKANGTGRIWPKFVNLAQSDNIGRTLTKEQFRWLVFMERGLEFAGEHKRWFDLKRMMWDNNTLMYDYMMNTYIPARIAEGSDWFATNSVMASRKKFWPKPENEIERNKGYVHQNPGF